MASFEKQQNASEWARCLAELSRAVNEAQQLAWSLGYIDGTSAEARELYSRLESMRTEVEWLRHGRSAGAALRIGPKWPNLFPPRPDPDRS